MPRRVSTCVRVISLLDDAERRASFMDRARDAEVAWAFFDACTDLSASLQYDEDIAIVRRGRPLSPRELACYSSHYAVWAEFIASGNDQLVVLEDDTVVDWRFMQRICSHDFAASGAHFVRLASLALPPSINMGEFLGRYLIHYLGYALGSQGYLFTRQGAEHMHRTCAKVRGPIDDALDQTWWGGLPNLGIYHHPVLEMSSPSRIGASRNATFRIPSRLRLKRFWFRVQEKLRSRGYRFLVRAGFGPRIRGVDRQWL